MRRLLAVLLLAVSATTAAAMIPTFGDLKAASAEMASHDCECPDGCPENASDCADMPDCPLMHAGLVAGAPPAASAIEAARATRFFRVSESRDSLTRAPPFHPPRT